MPTHRTITRLHIEPDKLPSACQPIVDELNKAYDEIDHCYRQLRAANLETAIQTDVGLQAKAGFEAIVKAMEADYQALVSSLRRKDAAFADELERRLKPLNNIHDLLSEAGIPTGEAEDVRLLRLLRINEGLRKTAAFHEQLIELYEKGSAKVTRDPTPPGTLTPVNPERPSPEQ